MDLKLKNVRVHNLKGVDLKLKGGELIVFTGVSGSGKSSVAFDTIYVEGQRRYVSSLSSFARRYHGGLPKPEADLIEGISPTVAIEQKSVGRSPRSTVGTMTGVYDYLRVLFARAGEPHCPESGERVTPQSTDEIVRAIPEGEKILFLAPFAKGKKGEFKDDFADLLRKGFMRVRVDGTIHELTDPIPLDKNVSHDIEIVIDRLVSNDRSRVTEAVTNALEWGKGVMSILIDQEEILFSQLAHSAKSGLSYPPLEPHDFSFNHPLGMCEACEGLGITQEFDIDAVIDQERSISEDCCKLVGHYETVKWGNIFRGLAKLYNFSVETPWKKLPTRTQNILLYGNKKKWTKMTFTHPVKKNRWTEYVRWKGLLFEAKQRYLEAKSEAYKKRMREYLHEGTCSECQGSRIKPYPSACLLQGKTIREVTLMPTDEALAFFESFDLPLFDQLLLEIRNRLRFLLGVGLSYLTLDRTSPTLSGGEAQRVRLASQIGSGLVGATYILDEPSIGLHPRDNHKLIQTLKSLRDRGNTVIVVEHDEEMIESADHVVDIGPFAGTEGGEICAQGTAKELKKNPKSLTGKYLSGKESIPTYPQRKKGKKGITLSGCTHHNLKEVTAHFPLGLFISVTGVSGSGKSSLVAETLYPALFNFVNGRDEGIKHLSDMQGADGVDKVIMVNQSPIGRTPRSNPSTYIKLLDDVRDLFARLPESAAYGYGPGRFSFNVLEGSCANCRGMGQVLIDMDFMEDVFVKCPTCKGKRYDHQTLSIRYKGKTIADVLAMTVGEALLFFENIPQIYHKLDLLTQVGLDYITLGQSATTLSGGEAQRIKLAKELIRPATGNTIYILDEPTTGLHFHDIAKLIDILQRLVSQGNTVIVIEHNQDLIERTDYSIELGPEGGGGGGQIIYEGPPREEKIAGKQSPTKSTPTRTHVIAKGCRENNLKNLDIEFPRNQITICCGPSGSGKSSFAFDTIYAEGQRRYVDSLPTYVRQIIKQMPKPHAEEVDGLSPAIAIEQKHHAGNPRSTVGTMTETYDFLRLLYSHLGTPYCPETGEKIVPIDADYVVTHLMKLPENTKVQILSPIDDEFDPAKLQRLGFLRIRLNGEYYDLDETVPYDPKAKNELLLVIDRLILKEGVEKRLRDAIEQAGSPFVVALPKKDLFFNLAFAVPSTGKTYPSITPQTFSFNADEGMCHTCLGLGFLWGADLMAEKEVLRQTPYNLMNKLWKEHGSRMADNVFLDFCDAYDIDPDVVMKNQPSDAIQKLIVGNIPFESEGMELIWVGLNSALAQAAKSRIGPSITPFMQKAKCPDCQGSRLNPLARNVKIKKLSLADLCAMPIEAAHPFIGKIKAPKFLGDAFKQLTSKLAFLLEIGLGYISLDRMAPTLSGGETQRIYLARQLGAGLTGCLYVLDEPTIGLHPYNNERLNGALKKLADLGNTLLLVEHDPMTLEIADHLIDFGPQAGRHGGEVMAEGSLEEIKANPNSLTGQYLSGKKKLSRSKLRREIMKTIPIENADVNNLKGFSFKLPIGLITVVTGVSGSGKSTLVNSVIKKQAAPHFPQMLIMDQNPIGTTARADICTYTETLKLLRDLYSETPEAKKRGLKAKHFSYNHLKGMCRKCWGLGYRKIRLQFLPPVKITCESCHGHRLNPLSLEVTYKGKNLGQILELTVNEAFKFLPSIEKLERIFNTLIDVGLGYLTLGQTVQSLSGGEAQRLRLSKELSKRTRQKALYLFDEPTIGLHPDDVGKLHAIFHTLANKGHTLVIIEHNLDVLLQADQILDLGPGAGEAGGELIAQGTPEEIVQSKKSLTGRYLKPLLS